MKLITPILPLVIAFGLALMLGACGGGSSSEASSQGSGTLGSTSSTAATSTAHAKGQPEGDGGLESFGSEASSQERDAASKVLEENLQARAAEDWSGQCAALSAEMTKEIVERAGLILGKKGTPSCAKGLELEAEPVSPSVLKDPMNGPIDALRVEGNEGYALFHGADGKAYAMPMVEEDGRWTVGQLTTIELGKG